MSLYFRMQQSKTLRNIRFFFFSREENADILCVTDWGQNMSFYTISGKLVRNFNFAY